MALTTMKCDIIDIYLFIFTTSNLIILLVHSAFKRLKIRRLIAAFLFNLTAFMKKKIFGYSLCYII